MHRSISDEELSAWRQLGLANLNSTLNELPQQIHQENQVETVNKLMEITRQLETKISELVDSKENLDRPQIIAIYHRVLGYLEPLITHPFAVDSDRLLRHSVNLLLVRRNIIKTSLRIMGFTTREIISGSEIEIKKQQSELPDRDSKNSHVRLFGGGIVFTVFTIINTFHIKNEKNLLPFFIREFFVMSCLGGMLLQNYLSRRPVLYSGDLRKHYVSTLQLYIQKKQGLELQIAILQRGRQQEKPRKFIAAPHL